ncbi:MAG TPA: hypothetical protein VLL76_06430, partial [Candidatus Omnitrophota bacterium]|nr:hypothetical protein [Candidatus Omnitrophota bacterium]
MWIGRLWPRRAKAPPSQPPAKAAASPRALSGAGGSGGWHTGYLDPRTFVAAVKQLLEQSRTLNPRLHVFSLADFRQAAGGKWDRIADMVTTVTESIIRRHLNPKTDIFTQIDAETSLLALPLSSRGDARTCVAAIARDLATHLFGDAVIAGRRPQVVAGNMAMEEAVTEDGDLDMGAVRRAVREAAPALAPDEPKWAVLTPPHRAELARLLLPEPPLGGGDVPEWAELHVHHQAAEAEVRPLLPTTTLG